MVTLVPVMNHLIVICISIYFTITNVNGTTGNITSEMKTDEINSSKINGTKRMKSPSFINNTFISDDKSIETQIEMEPIMAVDASNYEPSSVNIYDDTSNGYNDYNEKKQHEHSTNHDHGEKDSHEKGWEKLKEKERRVKDRGAGFIKAFTWDREEISKDKYKDKGHEKDSHRDYSKNNEYEKDENAKQHSSKHVRGHRGKSMKANMNHADLYQHDPGVHQTGELSALDYDPNALLYASQLAQAYPSSQTMYIPSYHSSLTNRALMSRLLY